MIYTGAGELSSTRTIRWGALAALLVPAVWITTSRAQATQTMIGEPAQARPAPRPADLVLRNGKIVTVDAARPDAQAMAVGGDTIVALGSNQEIRPYIGPSTRVIDLKGALAVPGLIDAHAHFTGVGEAARNLKLATAKNWDDIVRMVADAVKKAKPGEWIIGRGWHQDKWSAVPSPSVEGFPLHDELSKASPDNPVWLTHASGHAGFANAMAMKMAEVGKTTPNPAGGKILRDKDGNATGLFNERAQSIVHQGIARRRQAGRHHRPVEGHHDDSRGPDSVDRGPLHDRRRARAVRWRRRGAHIRKAGAETIETDDTDRSHDVRQCKVCFMRANR